MKVKKKIFIIIGIIINILILFIGSIKILTSHQEDIILENIPLYSWGEIFSNDGYFNQKFPSSKYWFSGEAGSLEPGVYNVTVFYETNSEHFFLYCDSDTDGNEYPAILSDTYLLDSQKNSLSFQTWVNDKISCFKLFVECGETDKIPDNSYLYLNKIEIARSFRGTVCYSLAKLILLLCVLDGILSIYLARNRIKDNFYIIIGLCAILIASSLELFTYSQVKGHDLPFHLGRIVGLQESLVAGGLPVKIQGGWCNGYGYAVSVFYGDIFLYFPAILYGLKIPLVYAYKIYVFMINLGTLVIAYYSFKRISKDKYIGVVCTACYCLSINRVLNIYLRAAVGEYSAFMFLPLIVLGMWEILTLDIKKKELSNSWLILTIGMSGIIQTHTLSFEMVCIFLVIVCLVSIRRVAQKAVLLELCKGSLATICLNLGFLVPFLDYARQNLRVFSKQSSYGIQGYGLSLYELLSMGTTATGVAQSATNGFANRFPVSIGLTMLITLMASIILLVRGSEWKRGEKKQLISALFFSVISIYLSTVYFPWNKIASIKLVRNVASSIQFPWRFISIAVPILTLLTCLILMYIKCKIRSDYMNCIMIGLCVLMAYQGLQCMDMIVRNSGNYVKYDGSHLLDIKETLSNGEYLFEGTDINLALKDSDLVSKNLYKVCMNKTNNYVDIWCVASENAYIELPLFAYPYYQCVDVETGKVYTTNKGSNNKIRVDLPDNYNGNLRISFKEPWYWRVSEVISILAFIALLAYIYRLINVRRIEKV